MSNANQDTQDDLYGLMTHEIWWRDRYELLLKHGYELRPRFRPGWTPSWTIKKKKPALCEDSHASQHSRTIDAKRLSDGKRVMIKRLVKGSRELEIARFFSSEELLKDPRNHCAPVLDVFGDESADIEFMVMPLLVDFDSPPFFFVDEALDFIEQMLEGLVFMHEHGVAHRDCSDLNIMMDGDALYPKGFLPGLPFLDATGDLSSPRRRRNVSRLTYYFTDFGISSRFDGTEEDRLVEGIIGQDKTVPEMRTDLPYDPFAVDIFVLGKVFRRHFTMVYDNMLFLKPLIDRMIDEEPENRPTAQEALRTFHDLVQQQPPRSLRWALIYSTGTKFERAIWGLQSISYETVFTVKRFLCIAIRRPWPRHRTDKTRGL